ncbi:hypothetical protein AB3K92_35400 [Burkholderia sp. Bmkn7]|uniref:hypothetical protein n=1 Tax=Burkholderia sp. Bmkn7 TaxID=3236841 RepID=UPI0034E490BE
MRRVSGVLNLQDNDALWSIIAVLEYYARLYEAMPERIRWASEGSLEAARREIGGANDALMQQHRCAVERCKATIKVAENLIQEHEARYREALANLNETSLTALSAQLTSHLVRTTGNRMIGAVAISGREQRERLDEIVGRFEKAVDAAARVDTMVTAMKRRLVRATWCLWLTSVTVLGLMLLVAGGWVDGRSGHHPSGTASHAAQGMSADGRP